MNLIFYNVQISTNFEKIILKFVILSIALAWNGYHIAHSKGNNSHQKLVITFNVRIKLSMCRRCIVNVTLIKDLYEIKSSHYIHCYLWWHPRRQLYFLIGWNFTFFLRNHMCKGIVVWKVNIWPSQKFLCFFVNQKSKKATMAGLKFNIGSYEFLFFMINLLWNHWFVWIQTCHECFLDAPLQNVCLLDNQKSKMDATSWKRFNTRPYEYG